MIFTIVWLAAMPGYHAAAMGRLAFASSGKYVG
jgi:hypothetical protein